MGSTSCGEPPFRADHIGSLLRPRWLMQAREKHEEDRLSAEELRLREDEAIRDAVRMQEEVGLQSVTDGEFRRASWHMDFIYQLGGVSKAAGDMKVEFQNSEGKIEFTPAALRIDGRVRLEHTIFGEDFEYLKSVAAENTPKLTIPSPNMVHYRGGRAVVSEEVYPEMDEFWADLTDAYAEEIRHLRAAEVRARGQDGRARARDHQERETGGEGYPQAPHRRGEPYVDPDQLCISPQCGFSSTLEGNDLTHDEQRAKLELIVQTAEERSGARLVRPVSTAQHHSRGLQERRPLAVHERAGAV